MAAGAAASSRRADLVKFKLFRSFIQLFRLSSRLPPLVNDDEIDFSVFEKDSFHNLLLFSFSRGTFGEFSVSPDDSLEFDRGIEMRLIARRLRKDLTLSSLSTVFGLYKQIRVLPGKAALESGRKAKCMHTV